MENIQALEDRIKLMLKNQELELSNIRHLIITHEKHADREISAIDRKIIDLEARIKALELTNAATRPGIDFFFKLIGIAAGAILIWILSGGRITK